MENRKYVKFLAPVILLGLFLVWPKISFGYDSGTHELLTDTAIQLYGKNVSKNKLDSNFNNFILDGTRREDDPPRWMNHFYDPIYERGLTEDNAIDPLYKLGNWQESKLWAQDGANQNKIKYSPIIATILSSIQSGKIEKYFPTADFTWREALRYWIQGDKEMAMFSLGHVLHLIQDVSVPDHTRNDPHPGDSPYENYTSQFTLANPDTSLAANILKANPIQLNDLDSYFSQLATYSNNNFYSKDTIGIQSGYSSPESDSFQPIVIDGQLKYYGLNKDPDNDSYLLVQKNSTNGRLIFSNSTDLSIDNKNVQSNYWRLLSPKAVEYSAGVINLFFDEIEKNKDNPEFTQKDRSSFLGQVIQTVKSGYDSAKNFVLGVFGTGQFEPIEEVDIDDQTNESTVGQNLTRNDSPSNSQPNNQNQSNIKQVDRTYKVTRVIDGDTIVLENGSVVRYIGIDAPELSDIESKSDCLAKEARERNKQLVLNKNVRLESGPQKTDAYDRTLAYVWNGDSNANATLIKEGFAYSYNFKHSHPREDEFSQLQSEAKSAKAGIWGSMCSNIPTSNESPTSTSENSPSQISATTTRPKSCLYSSTQSPSHSGLQINEVAWMGSANSTNDEWIEIKNISSSAIPLSGYWLIGRDNQIEIDLEKSATTSIQPSEFLLFERSDDNSVPGIAADIIYSGSLGNTNEGLRLFSPGCVLIDEVLASSQWPAGDNITKKTMERDQQGSNWHSSLGAGGTPKQENSSPSRITVGGGGGDGGGGGGQTPQSNPQSSSSASSSDALTQFFPVTINEIMYNPERSDVNHEWIEILNNATTSADISEWKILENNTAHKLDLILGSPILQPKTFAIITDDGDQFQKDYPIFSGALFDASFSLSNEGETISLKNGDLKIDAISYASTDGANGNGKSIQKFNSEWKEAAPTPGRENALESSDNRQSFAPSHLLISEIQIAGTNADDEFIEIYNPTQNEVSLSGYSIQYLSGKATSTKNVYKKNLDPTQIAPLSFTLLANKDGIFSQNSDATYSFSLSGESSGGVVLLSNSSSTIESLNQDDIVDLVAYGNVEMPGVTKAVEPEKSQSIERRALSGNNCVSAQNDGEFMGNSCDTNDSAYDFEIRLSPRGQKISNLAEPRTAPDPVQNLSILYDSGSTRISSSWQAPAENGAAQPFTYEISDLDTDIVLATTTLLTSEMTINEIGRDYSVSLKVIDREGLGSTSATSTILVPSFLESISIFENPQNQGEYYIEGAYEKLPLSLNSNPVGDILVFFSNKDAAKEPFMEGGYPNTSSAKNDIIPTDYRHCSGVSGNRDFLALTQNSCPQIGMMTEAIPQEYLEDKIFSVKNNPANFISSSDYLTIAFYTFDHSNLWSGGTDIYKLIAVDKTKYYASNSLPQHSPPHEIQNFVAELHDQDKPYVLLKWADATDTDSVDQFLTYEYNITKNDAPLDDNAWKATKRESSQSSDGNGGMITTQTGPQIPLTETGNYTFYLRAKDELGLVSTSTTSTVNIVIPNFLIGVQDEECPICNTSGFLTSEKEGVFYKLGQTFTLEKNSIVSSLTIELHNNGGSDRVLNGKISIFSLPDGNPNNIGPEIYSAIQTNLPSLNFPNMNYATIKFPTPLPLNSGTYFIALESSGVPTAPNQWLMSARTPQSKYPQGQMYVIDNPLYRPELLWRPIEGNVLFFKLFGS